MQGETEQETIAKAVWSCYQENPTKFLDYTLFDLGAYSEKVKPFRLAIRVNHPEQIEEWEVDEIVEKLEDMKVEERTEKPMKPIVKEKMVEEKLVAIGKQLVKISEELSGIARILMEGKEVGLEVAPPPKEELPEEEKIETIYFKNQLRGYNIVFTAFRTLKNDMCNNGLNLPVSVNKSIKKLKKLQEDLDRSSIPLEKNKEIRSRIEDFLRQTEELPTDPGPCQKTVGNCKLGKGCFATGAFNMLRLITEPTR